MKKIKICGLTRPEDIETVNLLKPEYCGFVINFPKSKRNLIPEQVKLLRRELNPSVIPVGVFVNQPPELVAELLNQGVVSIAQLHGQETEEYLTTLRSLTVQPIWQAFQVKTGEELQEYLCACDLYCQPGDVSATMQNSICCDSAVLAYPYEGYVRELDYGNILWVKTVEDITEVFRRLAKNAGELDVLKENSHRCARELLDYRMLAARLYR